MARVLPFSPPTDWVRIGRPVLQAVQQHLELRTLIDQAHDELRLLATHGPRAAVTAVAFVHRLATPYLRDLAQAKPVRAQLRKATARPRLCRSVSR